MHEIELTNGKLEPLGVELDLACRFTRLTDKGYWRIKKGLERFLRMRKADGKTVEILVGHCTSAGL
eukprot:12423374-Karenia_brevis.AAC.1